MFQRVLCRQYEEGIRQRIGGIADRHLTLLHRLEQGTLYLGRRTVDLIGQHEIGEDRTLLDRELFGLLAVNQCTDQIGGQQIGGKLNTAEPGVYGLCQCRNGKRFGQSRNTFQQNVAIGQQSDQQRVDQMFLSDDHFTHLHVQRIDEYAFPFDAFIQLLNIDYLTHIFYVTIYLCTLSS